MTTANLKPLPFICGDRVTSKKTGLPMTGMIVGIQYGWFFEMITPGFKDRTKPCLWDDLYPGWQQKPVFTVLLEGGPRPIMSYEEWVKSAYEEWRSREAYEENCLKTNVIAYPQDDLELLEE